MSKAIKHLIKLNKKAQKLRDKRFRTYAKHKDHGTDISYENEIDKFFNDLANNTPNAEQFEKKDLE
tara:strand:+ start:2171 stop:2368 length:198 start_codon:yes stop_codon:yes gene_type:complete